MARPITSIWHRSSPVACPRCGREGGIALSAKHAAGQHVLLAARMPAQARQIIVIGAGIGGLAAGLALQGRGFKVVVYERAAEIREIGAGVVIAPNARRALRDLGLDAALESLSCSVSVLHTCNYATGEIVRTNHNGLIIEQQGMGVLQVHRADLHGLLLEAVRANDPTALRAGHEFTGLEQDATGVAVSFANGAC